MRIKLIVNPVAGHGRGAKVGRRVEQLFSDRGIDCDASYSEAPRHATEIAQGLDIHQFDSVVSVGGDGTLFEVLNGLLRANAPKETTLGIIPVGTGNSFSQDLGVFNNPDAAVEAIISGQRRSLDVGYFSSDGDLFYFVNILGFGFVSDVCDVASRYKALRHLSYVIGVFQVTVSLASYQLELTVDGKKYFRKNCFVEICNSRYTAGTMLMAPQARIDDGLLDVVILNDISRRALLKYFPLIFKGEHLTVPEVEVFRGTKISASTNIPKILTPDGEILGQTPIEVGIFPKRLQVLGLWNM